MTPSLKYSQRGGKGEVVVTHGSVQGTRWVGRKAGAAVQVKQFEGLDDPLQSSYKYMFQRLRDVRNGKTLQLYVWSLFVVMIRLKLGLPLHPVYHIPSIKSVQYACLHMFDVEDRILFLSAHREDRGARGEPQGSLQHWGVLSCLLTCSGTQLLERSRFPSS